MARRFVRQPNGKLGLFSDVVDAFTWLNLTEEEALEVCRDEMDLGPKGSVEKVRSGVEDHEPWKFNVKGDGLSRWREAIGLIERVHGKGSTQYKEAVRVGNS